MAITTWKLNRDEQLNWLLELNTKEYKISNTITNTIIVVAISLFVIKEILSMT